MVSSEEINTTTWTPNHHAAARYAAIQPSGKPDEETPEYLQLDQVTEIVTKQRKRAIIPNGSKCISVLHVMNNGVINYPELVTYDPIYPGIRCFPNDVLISKINPHIPRILVVPDFGFPTTCSSEFEILVPRSPLTPYGLVALLNLSTVQQQIIHMTSGTSSSHRRIKTDALRQILIPTYNGIALGKKRLDQLMLEFEKAMRPLNHLMQALEHTKSKLQDVFEKK